MRLILFLFCFLSAAFSTAQIDEFPAADGGQPRHNDKAQQEETRLHYDAIRKLLDGNPDEAETILIRLMGLNPKNHAAAFELARIYDSRFKYQDAIVLMEMAKEAEPLNFWYNELLLNLYQKAGQAEAYLKQIRETSQRFPDKADLLERYKDALIAARKTDEAVAVMNQLIEKGIDEEKHTLQIFEIQVSRNKKKDAIRHMEQYLTRRPCSEKASIIFSNYLFNNKKPSDAVRVLDNLLKCDTTNEIVTLTLAEYYFKNGDSLRAHQYVKKAFSNPRVSFGNKIQYIISFYPLEKNTSTNDRKLLELIGIISRIHPEEPQARILAGDFYYISEKYNEAASEFESAIRLNAQDYSLYEKLMVSLATIEDTARLSAYSHRAIGLYPLQPLPYYFEGMVAYQAKRYEYARKMFEQGLKYSGTNEALAMQFFLFLGDLCNYLKDFSASDSYYEKLLRIDSTNYLVLNNYSYSLAERKIQLERAYRMAHQAYHADSINPSYVDTYGWVLYRMGRFSEAEVILKKAVKLAREQQGVIFEHYGDVLYRLQRKEEAIEYWRKAKEAGDHSEMLDRKIETGQLYEQD